MPQVQSITLIGRDGRELASSAPQQLPADADFGGRDYFKVQTEGDVGTYVGDLHAAAGPGETDMFDISRRLTAPDESFRGVIAIAVRPRYFDDFYTMIEQSPGNFYALVRSDGVLLARYPWSAPQVRRLTPGSMLRRSISQGLTHGLFSVDAAEVDHIDRRIAFRKVPDFPVYAIAGTETAAIRSAWFSMVVAHLIFALPATLLLFFTLWVALRRTRRLHDEAERREVAEDALRQAQRLEAIGQLTGGVAHDFNNLLMIVSGTVQRLRRSFTGESETHLLDTITNATQRGESLTRQLLAFSRRQMLQPSVIDLAERLPEIKDMLSRSLRGDIEIRVAVPRRSCAIKVDPNEFELALLNLAVNARDAMPSGGTLTITAKPILMRGRGSKEGLSGEFVAIRIADTGSGIPPEILPRVFEPFFTTKEVAGLGLSQVYGFARQSGGAASITTLMRRGTAVTLFLPRTWETPARPRQEIAVGAAAPPAGVVLLVEDNQEVAEVAQAYFEQLGYSVRHAAGAQAGLNLIESEPGIDLVFSDILMPGGMNGLELADAVRRRYPEIAVLLTTGYSSGAQDAVRRGFAVLQKPYDLATLERALRDTFGASGQEEPAAERVAG